MGDIRDEIRPYECKGCRCLSCRFKGDCHCPRKKGDPIPVGCDNFLTKDGKLWYNVD